MRAWQAVWRNQRGYCRIERGGDTRQRWCRHAGEVEAWERKVRNGDAIDRWNPLVEAGRQRISPMDGGALSTKGVRSKGRARVLGGCVNGGLLGLGGC